MPVPLRSDFGSGQLRRFARRTKDAPQARRLLALAAIYDGATRTQAAAIGGVTLQIVRDWVVKFNAHGPDGLIDRKAPGQPSRLNDTHRSALATMIESGPIPAVHGGRAVASDRPVPVAPDHGGQADLEPGAARHGLSQAVGPAASPRSGRGSGRGF